MATKKLTVPKNPNKFKYKAPPKRKLKTLPAKAAKAKVVPKMRAVNKKKSA